jgi:alpha-tubulin suppressor-like RCC1 family protein
VKARISGLAELVAGNQATCGRKPDGTLWCWGRVLSNDEDELMSPPTHISLFGSDVRHIDLGESTAFVSKADGSAWSYEHGDTVKRVESGAGQLSLFYDFTFCFVLSDGTLGCDGENATGILGNGTTTAGRSQVLVPSGTAFKQVSVGSDFACGLSEAGEVWCWGVNDVGQTGTRQSSQNCPLSGGGARPCNSIPVKVSGLPSPAKAISTGGTFALALLTDGSVWGWGSNVGFELGLPPTEMCDGVFGRDACHPTPVKVPVQSMVSISAGTGHSCGCAEDGTAWCWGHDEDGKLGTPDSSSLGQPPVQVQGFRCW